MTRSEEIEKARPKDLNFRCDDIHCCASKVWTEACEWTDKNPDLASRQGAIKNTIEWHASRVKIFEADLALAVEALKQVMNNIGVPQPGYPAPVAVAYDIARDALAKIGEEK